MLTPMYYDEETERGVRTPTKIRAGSLPGLSDRPPRDREMRGERRRRRVLPPVGRERVSGDRRRPGLN